MTWTDDELARVGDAEELKVSSYRRDGSLRKYITIWVVRSGDELYIRSAYGPDNGWFRRAKASARGRIKAGGVEHDVEFADASGDDHAAIDAAYHAKYDRHGARIVKTVVGDQVVETTLRLVPVAD